MTLPEPFYERDGITIYVGDNRDVLPHIEPVHAVVTDPPYGLSFMGKGWDHQVPGVEFWQAIGDAMLPGAHLLAFGGTRTYHRIAVAIEDAGYEIRDTLQWLYGSGFPKSHDVSKAIDKAAVPGQLSEFIDHVRAAAKAKGFTYRSLNDALGGQAIAEHVLKPSTSNAAWPTRDTYDSLRRVLDLGDTWDWLYADVRGAERPVIGKATGGIVPDPDKPAPFTVGGHTREFDITAPATPEAEQWQGWGTALKPAYEPIIMARSPFKGTVAAQVLATGTGAINVDACRVPSTDGFEKAWDKPVATNISSQPQAYGKTGQHTVDLSAYKPAGRWPSNVILDEAAAELLDAQSGESKSGTAVRHRSGGNTFGGDNAKPPMPDMGYGDTGGASRFFKVVEQDENPCNHAEFMVQYDCNCEAVEGDQWVKQGHQVSTQAGSDTPRRRDTTDSPSGTANERAPSWHTSTNGSSTTAPSLMDTRSTTSTATSRTTASRTCNCSTPQPTSASTQAVNSEMVNGGSHALSVASSSPSTPSTGTSAEKAGHSTDDAERVISARSLPINNGDAPASRFLYVPKASRRERNMGLPEGETSSHPTVKPLALMRYLIQMVTPPGGIILDPFMGSGSTLVAAAELGFPAIGIELDPEYAEIAARRVDHALNERARRLPGLEALS